MVPRIFVPQIVRRFDQSKGKLVNLHDFTPAMTFGQIEPILDENDDPNLLSRLTPKIKNRLSDFTHEDFFLAVGDPGVIAVCCGIILRQQPSMTMLKWVRELKTYVKLDIRI